MIESKIRPLFSIVIILITCIFCIWFANELLNYYYSFDGDIIYSWFSATTIIMPFSLTVPFLYFSLSLIKGDNYAKDICTRFLVYYKWGLILLFVLSVIFSFYYLNLLNEYGYTKCEGIPAGYMPGMGTRYVLDLSFCNKR